LLVDRVRRSGEQPDDSIVYQFSEKQATATPSYQPAIDYFGNAD
jgi:hypothetical protein